MIAWRYAKDVKYSYARTFESALAKAEPAEEAGELSKLPHSNRALPVANPFQSKHPQCSYEEPLRLSRGEQSSNPPPNARSSPPPDSVRCQWFSGPTSIEQTQQANANYSQRCRQRSKTRPRKQAGHTPLRCAVLVKSGMESNG